MPLRFSIITVCFNSRAVLPKAVESLAAQTYPHREWVVVDGGSSDGTQDYVHHAPEKLGPFVSEKDKGIYDAMNKGIRMATGEVLFFLNSDDALHDPEVLADVAQLFERDPSLDFLYGSVVMCKGQVQTFKSYHHVNHLTLPFEDLCHQSVFARRRVFESIGFFEPKWKTSADYDWFIRVFRSRCKVKCTSRKIAYFNDGGMHTQNPQALMDERKALRLQYMSPMRLRVGTFLSRLAHKLSKIMRNGYVIGERKN
jgi:glycosyltransferase involved in cell wall biosynthesis